MGEFLRKYPSTSKVLILVFLVSMFCGFIWSKEMLTLFSMVACIAVGGLGVWMIVSLIYEGLCEML